MCGATRLCKHSCASGFTDHCFMTHMDSTLKRMQHMSSIIWASAVRPSAPPGRQLRQGSPVADDQLAQCVCHTLTSVFGAACMWGCTCVHCMHAMLDRHKHRRPELCQHRVFQSPGTAIALGYTYAYLQSSFVVHARRLQE